MTQSKKKILSDFESLIDSWILYVAEARDATLLKSDSKRELLPYFNETRGKDKDFQYSIWQVYDLCSKSKKPNFTSVARQLTIKTGQAVDDSVLKAGLKAVKRSYKSASDIIKSVEGGIPKNDA